MARVGLGSLGVVTKVTLQCVPAHELVEHTFVATSEQVRREHAQLLRSNKHVRYMWIPYTHDVVLVTDNPLRQVSIVMTHFLLLFMPCQGFCTSALYCVSVAAVVSCLYPMFMIVAIAVASANRPDVFMPAYV